MGNVPADNAITGYPSFVIEKIKREAYNTMQSKNLPDVTLISVANSMHNCFELDLWTESKGPNK